MSVSGGPARLRRAGERSLRERLEVIVLPGPADVAQMWPREALAESPAIQFSCERRDARIHVGRGVRRSVGETAAAPESADPPASGRRSGLARLLGAAPDRASIDDEDLEPGDVGIGVGRVDRQPVPEGERRTQSGDIRGPARLRLMRDGWHDRQAPEAVIGAAI